MTIIRDWLDRLIVTSLCIFIFVIPFSKSMIEACFMTAFVLWIFKRTLSYQKGASLINLFKPVGTVLSLPLFLFILAGFLSIFTSASVSLSLRAFFSKLLKGVFLYFIITETIDNKKKLNFILISMFLSMLTIGIDGIFQFIKGWDFLRHYPNLGRVSASFINPNGFGGWLTVMLPLALSIGIFNKGFRMRRVVKIMVWVLICILALCLVTTYSRGAWLGTILALLFVGILKKRKFLIFAIFIVLAAPFIIPDPLKNYILTTFPLIPPYPVKARLCSIMLSASPARINLWREAFAIIKDFPVFGCGLNTYSIVAPHYKLAAAEAGIYPHNSYLQMAAETGIVGLTSFLWIILVLFKSSLNSLKKIKDALYCNVLIGLLAGMFGFLVHSFFDVNFYALQLANLMWFIMGLIIAVQKTALTEESA